MAFLKIFFGLLISTGVMGNPYLGLPTLAVPPSNLQNPKKIALGKRLFNDRRFSANGRISCASCHQPDKAFTDGLPVAKGLNGQLGVRNTPTLLNAAFYDTQFLDGRANSLENQAFGPLVNPIEHGLLTHQSIVDVIQHDGTYPQQFQTVFGVTTKNITIALVTKAIASYERTLITGNTLFDRYLYGRDHKVLSTSAARGLDIFKNKAHCITCHEISWNNAQFTDNRFYNIGIGFTQLAPILDKFISYVNQGNNPDSYPLTPQQRSELGRFNITKNINDIGKFKNPSLRNIALTAPYMHDGSMKTLEEIVEHYDKGGVTLANPKNRLIDRKIFPLHLTPQEKLDLIAFMHTLTSPVSEIF